MRATTRLLAALALLAQLFSFPSPAAAVVVEDARTVEEILGSSDYSEIDAQTLRLYRAVLGREPDNSGAVYWVERRRDGTSLDRIAAFFADSPEFKAIYGDLDNSDFLDQLYRNVLERRFDQGGFDYWLERMNDGLSRGRVVTFFSDSSEFQEKYPYEAEPLGPIVAEPPTTTEIPPTPATTSTTTTAPATTFAPSTVPNPPPPTTTTTLRATTTTTRPKPPPSIVAPTTTQPKPPPSVAAPKPNGLTIRLTEDPFVCDGPSRYMGVVSGARPGERITFSSPTVNGLLPGTADSNGNLRIRWQCFPDESGTSWVLNARSASGTTGSVTIRSKAPGQSSSDRLTFRLSENPFKCDGGLRNFGTITGAVPGERITFTSPTVSGLLPGTANGSGSLTIRWQCEPFESGTSWVLNARSASGRTGTVTIRSTGTPPTPVLPPTPDTGPEAAFAEARAKYPQLGTPVGDGVHQWGGLWVQDFRARNGQAGADDWNGSILIYNPSLKEAIPVRQGFWWRYIQHGGPTVYGYPLNAESPGGEDLTIDKASEGLHPWGSRQDFTRGTLIWVAETGEYEFGRLVSGRSDCSSLQPHIESVAVAGVGDSFIVSVEPTQRGFDSSEINPVRAQLYYSVVLACTPKLSLLDVSDSTNTGIYDQLLCHMAGQAVGKSGGATWDLESWRGPQANPIRWPPFCGW